jgi:uncharacterized membrane protein HdeD (DUF308 family)/predicted flap endonuclease-1-like 5' DNA nuclease
MTTSTTTYGSTAVSPRERGGVPWWLVLIEGIAAIVVGLLLLTQPAVTTVVLVQLLGLYWLISGIFSIISIFIDSSMWGWKLFAGVLGILAGILIIQHPLWSALLVPTTFVFLLGFWGLIIGIVQIIQAFRGAGWGMGVLGVLSVIFGLFLLGNAFLGALSLPLVLGIFGVVGGIIAVFGSFRIRREKADSTASPAASTTAASVQAGAQTAATAAAAAAVSSSPVAEEKVEPVEAVSFTTPVSEEPVAVEEISEQVIPAESTEAAKFGYDLAYIEGIGPVYAQKLQEIGIANPADLLERGATPKGRMEIAELAGISGKLILEWVNHVDLYRIKGVGSEYADLLEEAGVDTVVELAMRNPDNLFQKIVQINEEKHLVRRLPLQSQVEDWVAQAKQLPRKVMY